MDWRMNYDDALMGVVLGTRLQALRDEAEQERLRHGNRDTPREGRHDHASLRVRIGRALASAGAAVAGDPETRRRVDHCGEVPATAGR